MMLQTTLSLTMLAVGAQSLSSCPSDIPLSCHNSTAVENTCCFNYPGGAFMQTQFWDTNPSTGPTDSWTIHGLWPDNCDGSYDSFCDESREYNNISAILKSQDRSELLSYMHEYWVDIDGDDDSFWAHEWNKHGTCINTIEPSCYQDYEPQQEVGEFFAQVVDLFKGLDTYQALADAGITPDESKAYSLSDVLGALKKMHGKEAVVLCSDGALEQAYYYFDVKGNAVDGTYKATSPLSDSDCPDSVKYLPKSG